MVFRVRKVVASMFKPDFLVSPPWPSLVTAAWVNSILLVVDEGFSPPCASCSFTVCERLHFTEILR